MPPLRSALRRSGFAHTLLLLATGVAAALPASAAPLFSMRTFSVGDGLPSAQIRDLAVDGSGRLWILSRGGIAVFDGHRFSPPPADTPRVAFDRLATDATGRVCALSTLASRVYCREEGRWLASPPLPERLSGPRVSCFAATGQVDSRRFAVGTGAGLWVGDARSWRKLTEAEGLPSHVVTGLAAYEGGLAIATAAGFATWTGAGLDDSLRRAEPRLGGLIRAIAPGARLGRRRLLVFGDDWIGAVQDGALVVLGEGLAGLVAPSSPGARARVRLGEDRTGGLYFGTGSQVFLLEEGTREARTLGNHEGLPGNGVTATVLDREGGFWIGGLRGLARIGSRRFLTLTSDTGLAEDEVTALASLGPGRVVAGHNRALTLLGDGEGRRVPLGGLPDSPATRVMDLALDGRGTLWAAAVSALVERSPDGGLALHREHGNVLSVEVDPRGRLWVIAGGRLWIRERDRLREIPLGTAGVPLPMLRWLATDGRDRLYVGTASGLFWRGGLAREELEREVPWERARAAEATREDVYAILAEPDATVLVGTPAGLCRLEGDAIVKVTGPAAIDRPIYFLNRDSGGRLWAGTDDGVFVGDERRHLTVRHGLSGRETNRGGFLADERGRVWIGTDSGLSIYRPEADLPPATAPHVEIVAIRAAGATHSPDADIELPSGLGTLSFQLATVAFSWEEKVAYRYRLDGLDEEWLQTSRDASEEVRYTNLAPGRYRLRVDASWRGRPGWGPEATSAWVSLAPPLWRRPWFLPGLALGLLGLALVLQERRARATRQRARELGELNAQLERSLSERQRLIAELESRNAELERFGYAASHDLKSPLLTVRTYAGSIERDLQRGRLERLGGDVGRIRNAADYMLGLVDHLLHVARAGRVVGTPTPIDLGELARSVTGRLATPGVRIEVVPGLPVVSGDPLRLAEVLDNLVRNALDHLGDRPEPRIAIGMRPGDPEPVLYVEDNGVGIAPPFHERIFDLFEKLDADSPRTGVGLALVRKIVEAHGGRVWVESEGIPGRGSRFCFTLPGVEEVRAAASE